MFVIRERLYAHPVLHIPGIHHAKRVLQIIVCGLSISTKF